jgi:hypothetical protein
MRKFESCRRTLIINQVLLKNVANESGCFPPGGKTTKLLYIMGLC